jgi:uncharacterized membrane protein (UPF0127 family)
VARLIDAETGEVLLPSLETAHTFWRRFTGLQFRRPLPPDGGLWLKPCSSIHTCFMRFPIDVVMLDQELRVLKVKRCVRPWRIVLCERLTKSVIETNANLRPWITGQMLAVQSDPVS